MSHEFADDQDLFERLTSGPNAVVYLVGSAVTAPCRPGTAGVPGVDGVIDVIRDGLGSPRWQARFDEALAKDPTNRYQAAFRHLLKVRDQDFANRMIRRSVMRARVPSTQFPVVDTDRDDPRLCLELEKDLAGWQLSPAVSALGVILAHHPGEPRSIVLTTNVDPLLGISIGRAGGQFIRAALHDDAHLDGLDGPGCLVVQLHGDWCRGDTLHVRTQRARERPKLAATLRHLLASRTLVVLGHSGGDNILLRSLIELVRSEGPISVAWAFRSTDPAYIEEKYAGLLEALRPGIEGGRIRLYTGVDVHEFLPALAENLYGPTIQPGPETQHGAPIRRPSIEREGFLRLVKDDPGPLPSDVAAAGISAMPAALALDVLHGRASESAASDVDQLRELQKYPDVLLLAVQVLAVYGHCAGWIGMTANSTPAIVLDSGHVVLADELPPAEVDLLLARGLLRERGAPVAIVVPRTQLPAALPTGVWNAFDKIRQRAYADAYLRKCARFTRQGGATLQIPASGDRRETLYASVHRWLARISHHA